MSANNRKLELRSVLAGKTTEELEELLAMDFAEDKKELDTDYISIILEVIEERETNTEEKDQRTLEAWEEFQAYRKEIENNETFKVDTSDEPILNHRVIEYRQSPKKHFSIWRVSIVAAVIIVLLCSTAFGWNLFQAIAEWTEETFSFLTHQDFKDEPDISILKSLENTVSLMTDISCVPRYAPEGTQEFGSLNMVERSDRCSIGMGYIAGDRSFTIQIVVHQAIPDSYSGVYQKDITIQKEYVSGGITHYIAGNLGNLSVAWTNNNVEGHIQGNLTVEEIQEMIDSIYFEE